MSQFDDDDELILMDEDGVEVVPLKNHLLLCFRPCVECGSAIGVMWDPDPAKVVGPTSCAGHS